MPTLLQQSNVEIEIERDYDEIQQTMSREVLFREVDSQHRGQETLEDHQNHTLMGRTKWYMCLTQCFADFLCKKFAL